MNNDITIVTAFFDIGRGDWTPENGLPLYLKRTNDTYMERFSHMATLKNKMVVYTSSEFVDQIKQLRGDNPTDIVSVDFKNSAILLRMQIADMQKNPIYRAKIRKEQLHNPEYWNADYVLVNLLKSSFVHSAIHDGHVDTELVAWLDFGYCRDKGTLNGIDTWKYPFNPNKIHFWSLRDWLPEYDITDVISTNTVFITGPCIVAGKEAWSTLEQLVVHCTKELLRNDLIDDDQTILLMSYLQKPELFEIHTIQHPHDWFIVFKEYNNV